MLSMRAVSPSPRLLLSAFRPASSFSPGSSRSPLSCLLTSGQHLHWPQVSFLQQENTLVRRLLSFEHTPLYLRSAMGAGLSVARAEALLQREGTASLLWERHSAAHSPDIPELPGAMPEHKALQKPWPWSEEAARLFLDEDGWQEESRRKGSPGKVGMGAKKSGCWMGRGWSSIPASVGITPSHPNKLPVVLADSHLSCHSKGWCL